MSTPRRRFNFTRAVGTYLIVAVIVALLIHFVVLRSPRYSWVFPVDVGGGAFAERPAASR